ncbi:hypothetical protein ACKFKF_32570 [Phormidesmis sp. 146-12]
MAKKNVRSTAGLEIEVGVSTALVCPDSCNLVNEGAVISLSRSPQQKFCRSIRVL